MKDNSISLIVAVTTRAEIGDFKRFQNPQQLPHHPPLRGAIGIGEPLGRLPQHGHEGALSLLVQDAASKFILYTAADIQRDEASDQVLSFLSFWKKQQRGLQLKAHFDVIMTMIADTLYSLLARNLRGFEACDAAGIYRLFVKGKARVSFRRQRLPVTFPRRAHNPILRSVAWDRMPQCLTWLDGAELELRFK
jgi:hypothetical protein